MKRQVDSLPLAAACRASFQFDSLVSYNHVTNSGFQYDAAGNMTHDASHSYTYDAENRITKVDGGSTATYGYDVDGRRVSRVVAGVETDYIYDLSGRVVADYGGGCGATCWRVGYVYLNGEAVAEYFGGTYFYVSDHLGSTRLLTGYPTASVVECDDFYPFGESISCGGTSTTTHKFTGKERDSESNLDMFGARYMSSSMGRFMTPDWASKPTAVPYAEFGDPQSLNLYSYVRNNPPSRADVDGHCWPFCDVALKIASWAGEGIGTQGGKQFSKNVGIGIAKGAGEFVYHAVTTAAAGTNPGAAVTAALDPGPRGLQPSNQTQAQVSTATQLTLAVASVVVPLAAEGSAATSTTALGDTFTHYGFLADADSFAGGLRPGSFATTEANLTGSEAQSGLALGKPAVPDAAYPITPEPGTPIVGPSTVQPAYGQPGGLPEVQFPNGTGPGTVGQPKQIAP